MAFGLYYSIMFVIQIEELQYETLFSHLLFSRSSLVVRLGYYAYGSWWLLFETMAIGDMKKLFSVHTLMLWKNRERISLLEENCD